MTERWLVVKVDETVLEVQERIARKQLGVRFLFASGYAPGDVHADFAPGGGLQLIPKPYEPDALLRKVRETLDA